MDKYYFLYCQKIVVFSADENSVLLCKRKNETDYEATFSFIGGKMQVTDKTFVDGLRREKNEEVGERFKIKICPTYTTNVLFRKKDGRFMILPHYYAVHIEGEIELGEEYSEYKWVKLDELNDFEPKIPTIPTAVEKMQRVKNCLRNDDFVVI